MLSQWCDRERDTHTYYLGLQAKLLPGGPHTPTSAHLEEICLRAAFRGFTGAIETQGVILKVRPGYGQSPV